MLSYFKNFVKNHQNDITLTLGIVLIALISFGAGLLVSLQGAPEPIIIQNPSNYSASIEQSLSTEKKEKETEQGRFIGSANSNKYHWPDCPWAKKIAGENQIWFNSEEEARNSGYIPCNGFEKHRPVNY